MNEFEEQFELLGENTEKYESFSIPVEKKVKNIDKDGNETVVTISFKIKFIDSTRFMVVHNQILVVISQKEFIKLNVKIVIVFLNIKVSRAIL